MILKKSAEQERREGIISMVNNPRNWMLASEREELDRALAKIIPADTDAVTDAWLESKFKQTRKEFLASRRMTKKVTRDPESAIPQQSIPELIKKQPSLPLEKLQKSPPKIFEKIKQQLIKDAPKRNSGVREKTRGLKLLQSYSFTTRSGEKITLTKLSRPLYGNEEDIHRNFNCKLAGECLSFVILQKIHHFSCVKCEKYFLNYRVLSQY